MARTKEGHRCTAGFRLHAYFLKNTNIIHTKYEYNICTSLRYVSMQPTRLVNGNKWTAKDTYNDKISGTRMIFCHTIILQQKTCRFDKMLCICENRYYY